MYSEGMSGLEKLKKKKDILEQNGKALKRVLERGAIILIFLG